MELNILPGRVDVGFGVGVRLKISGEDSASKMTPTWTARETMRETLFHLSSRSSCGWTRRLTSPVVIRSGSMTSRRSAVRAGRVFELLALLQRRGALRWPGTTERSSSDVSMRRAGADCCCADQGASCAPRLAADDYVEGHVGRDRGNFAIHWFYGQIARDDGAHVERGRRRRGAGLAAPSLAGVQASVNRNQGARESSNVLAERKHRVGRGGRVRGCLPLRGRRVRGRGGRRGRPRVVGGGF